MHRELQRRHVTKQLLWQEYKEAPPTVPGVDPEPPAPYSDCTMDSSGDADGGAGADQGPRPFHLSPRAAWKVVNFLLTAALLVSLAVGWSARREHELRMTAMFAGILWLGALDTLLAPPRRLKLLAQVMAGMGALAAAGMLYFASLR
jgi:hypothetical protein